MGWGVNDYPSAPIEPATPAPELYVCDGKGCGFETADEEEILGPCCAGRCKQALCVGCAYECVDCTLNFCRSHIVEHGLANHMAIYRCQQCSAAHQAQTVAA